MVAICGGSSAGAGSRIPGRAGDTARLAAFELGDGFPPLAALLERRISGALAVAEQPPCACDQRRAPLGEDMGGNVLVFRKPDAGRGREREPPGLRAPRLPSTVSHRCLPAEST